MDIPQFAFFLFAVDSCKRIYHVPINRYMKHSYLLFIEAIFEYTPSSLYGVYLIYG